MGKLVLKGNFVRSGVAGLSLLVLSGSIGCGGYSPPTVTGTTPGFNLDLSDAFTGLPNTYSAASGQAGAWNDCPVGTTSNLKDTAGNVTAVSITVTGFSGAFNTPTTDTGKLLGDYVQYNTVSATPVSISITGLANGTYRVYYYYVSSMSGFTANGILMPSLTADGSASARDSLGTVGFNWYYVDAFVTSGTLAITDSTPTSLEGISGLQIVPI
ncbi:MAG TPA: hypothetical protein VNI20_13760 [Fimbriimonadaceae bacterium]|nr:hypothetical protein [Fimbriimonadaceae bacterium]